MSRVSLKNLQMFTGKFDSCLDKSYRVDKLWSAAKQIVSESTETRQLLQCTDASKVAVRTNQQKADRQLDKSYSNAQTITSCFPALFYNTSLSEQTRL